MFLVMTATVGYWGRGETIHDAIIAAQNIEKGERVKVYEGVGEMRVDGVGYVYNGSADPPTLIGTGVVTRSAGRKVYAKFDVRYEAQTGESEPRGLAKLAEVGSVTGELSVPVTPAIKQMLDEIAEGEPPAPKPKGAKAKRAAALAAFLNTSK